MRTQPVMIFHLRKSAGWTETVTGSDASNTHQRRTRRQLRRIYGVADRSDNDDAHGHERVATSDDRSRTITEQQASGGGNDHDRRRKHNTRNDADSISYRQRPPCERQRSASSCGSATASTSPRCVSSSSAAR